MANTDDKSSAGQQGGVTPPQKPAKTPVPPVPPKTDMPMPPTAGMPMPPAGIPPQPPITPPMTPPAPPANYPPTGVYPSGGYYPPMDAGAYPPGGYYPPAGGGYPPAGGGYPPAGGGYPPAGGGYPPAGGGYPPAGGGYPPAGGGYPPAQPEDTTPANFQLGTKLPPKLNVKAPKHTLNFDEEYFIRLLAGSISLSKDEKKKIVESIPKLKQSQIDELIRIFEEEKQKFAALSKKHVPQLEKLAQQHYGEWMELENDIKIEQKKSEDKGKADEIRKNLGI